MGGLFGRKFNAGEALLGFFADPSVMAARAKRRQDAAEAEAEQQALARVHATIDADPGLSPQDKAYAKANPKAYIDQYMTRFGQVQMGPQGGLIGQRNAEGQIDWTKSPQMPNDTERDFELFKRELDPNTAKDFLRSKANPPRWIEVSDGQGGMRIIPVPSVPSAAPPASGAPLTDDDIRRMEQGGAGPAAAPRGFRRPY